MIRGVFVVAAALVAACAPPAPQAAQAPPNGCPASAATSWFADGGVEFRVEAAVSGADCAEAQAMITIRDPAGDVVLSETLQASQVMTLAGAANVAEMERRLGEWVSPAGAMADTTADLPAWERGAETPMNGEFPFYVEEGLDRAAYEALRARDSAMFCYVQGMESLACLAYENGGLRGVGAQTFPG